MDKKRKFGFVCFATCLTLACGQQNTGFELPRPLSSPPRAAHTGLYAGFGKIDITPAPGFPLAGNSIEGGQSTGYRHRLYARALVLEDATGERMAFVIADLGLGSSNLHRLTSEHIRARTGIGADRLVVSVTHTHSAPGSHFGVRTYNEESTPYAGYDPAMVDFLVGRFADAIETAFDNMRPAKASWDTVVVSADKALTRNRSFDAFLLNGEGRITDIEPGRPGETPLQTSDRQRREAVDRVMRLLRVDQCDTGWINCRPRGAFSIYAIHGTGNPPVNTLVDGDIHAIVERELERHIESLNGSLPSSDPLQCATRDDGDNADPSDCVFRSRAFHLFANGTEGDVSPNHAPGTHCSIEEPDRRVPGGDAELVFRTGRRPAGPRTPLPPEQWRRLPGRSVDDCLARARESTNRLGIALSQHAIRAFTKAGAHLTQDVSIRRAFKSYSFERDTVELPVCPEPRSGTANLGGAEDGRTRMYKWKFLFAIPSGIEEGGSAINPDPTGCFGTKLIVLGPLQGLVVSGGGLPRFMQLMVVRIGNGMLGTVPAEVTTEAGMRMKHAIRTSAPPGVEHVGIVGLANGYMQYVTTDEEYDFQSYEGGSNLYGPKTAAAITRQLSLLSQSITDGTPIVHVGPIVATPGKERRVLYRRTNGPRIGDIDRGVSTLSCTDGTLTGRWIDAFPGLFVPADGQVVEIQRRHPDGRWSVVAWDDDRYVEVHAVGPEASGYAWEVHWKPPTLPPGTYRLTLPARDLGNEGRFAPVPKTDVAVPATEC